MTRINKITDQHFVPQLHILQSKFLFLWAMGRERRGNPQRERRMGVKNLWKRKFVKVFRHSEATYFLFYCCLKLGQKWDCFLLWSFLGMSRGRSIRYSWTSVSPLQSFLLLRVFLFPCRHYCVCIISVSHVSSKERRTMYVSVTPSSPQNNFVREAGGGSFFMTILACFSSSWVLNVAHNNKVLCTIQSKNCLIRWTRIWRQACVHVSLSTAMKAFFLGALCNTA